MLRDLVLTRMGRYGDEATINEARNRFENHYNEISVLPADLRGPVSFFAFNLDFLFVLYQGNFLNIV